MRTTRTRSDNIRLLQQTIKHWDEAIAKHGPIPGFLQSRTIEENILVGYILGTGDVNGQSR